MSGRNLHFKTEKSHTVYLPESVSSQPLNMFFFLEYQEKSTFLCFLLEEKHLFRQSKCFD